MTAWLRDRPAWTLASGYVLASLGCVLVVGGPGSGTAGRLCLLAVLVLYVLTVVLRKHRAGDILASTVGVTALLSLANDAIDVSQPWKGATSALVPLAVYCVCDRGGDGPRRSEQGTDVDRPSQRSWSVRRS
ncbi:hypothetical protein [Conexibacter arvalis]|uniref:Drug/metabolite transporter (DMT)-like permease n=1 Tax=Conexibacter arvalis TaxID=912552 RepID=A0A840IHG8_9ACTN|nr:hypothetical protein [Conexibacter arvalis]MBB4663623.1 drug/metabolite transporter (DMT)-like permease [Conexibacter arvalis]